jgi:hypothetical protein
MTMGRCAPSRAPPTLANHTRPDLDCLYTMVDTPLVLEHSIEADVSPTFAWKFRTDITTWSDPPATFQLDGPFAEGVRGLTLMPRQEPLAWWIRDVRQGRSFAIEMPLDQATLRFEWHLGALSERRTKLTHRVILAGQNMETYRKQVEAGFGANLAAGLEKIAHSMVAAEK